MNNSPCVFYSKSFFDDLYSYNIVSNQGAFQIRFDTDFGMVQKPLTFRMPSLPDFSSSAINNDSWIPVLTNITNSDIEIRNDYLASGFVLNSENIGSESVIEFEPSFKNWNCSNGIMVADWILTPPLYPYLPEYGVMCWVKRPQVSGIDTSGVTIDKIPFNTEVFPVQSFSYISNNVTVSVDPSTKLIKKSDNSLLIVKNDTIKKDAEGNILPGTLPKYFVLSDLISQYRGSLTTQNILFRTSPLNRNLIYHISNGEAYSYYESTETKRLSIRDNMPPKTYISPVLHDIYRQIYHNLTLKIKKNFNKKIPLPIFNKKQGRRFKQICYFLATHPQIDRTTISILQKSEINDIIRNYIDSNAPVTQTGLQSVLIEISRYFKDVNIDEAQYLDPAYLPKKIIQKYGAKLQFRSAGFLSYKKDLPFGPHVKVKSDIRSLASKNISNSVLCDNIIINVGPFTARTVLDNSQSSLVLTSRFSNERTEIPLWDIEKTRVVQENVTFTAGPDIQLDFKNPDSSPPSIFYTASNSTGKELAIDLKVGLGFQQDLTALAGVTIGFEWTRISGSDCLRFSNRSITSVRNNGVLVGNTEDLRFESSNDESPTIYVKKAGKYTIQFTVITPFGIKSQAVNLYITDKTYSRPQNEIPRQERITSLLQDNPNVIMVHGLKEFAFGNQGIFWPIYSDLSIYQPNFFLAPGPLPGTETKKSVGNIVKPLGGVLNKFLIKYDSTTDAAKDATSTSSQATLSFSFEPRQGVISEIGTIELSNINSKLNPQCESIYREVFDNFLVDLEQDLSKVVIDPISKKEVEVARPSIIGTNEIFIRSSGNQSDLLKDAMFANKTESMRFDEFEYDSNIYGAVSNGFSNQINPAVCYEKYGNTKAIDDLTTIEMHKGYFHPNSGWLSQQVVMASGAQFNNRTSILIGDGLKRHCKTFKGLGFSDLNNDFVDDKVKIYKSSINLYTDRIAHDPPGNATVEERVAKDRDELTDHNINHGYRDLSGRITSLYKHTDEFLITPSILPDGPVPSNEYCRAVTDSNVSSSFFTIGETTSIRYGYPKPGPIQVPKTSQFRFDREFGRLIGDLEIKLDFLNYINPKELVIWLTIDPPSRVSSSLIKGRADPLYFSKNRRQYLDEINSIANTGIKSYGLSLFNLNDNPFLQNNETTDTNSEDPEVTDSSISYYLYLLNQDHIDMSLYNNVIKFTDNISDNNNNLNLGQLITANTSQTNLKNGIIEIAPTLSASGYSDEEINTYKTIIRSNELLKKLPCSFSKFSNMPLFDASQEGDRPPPRNSSAITFTLNIAVIGESDTGEVYDRILSTDNVLNINNVKTKNISSILTNSMCCWELILSNSRSWDNFESKDALGQIDYRSSTPKYEGYNFIAKIPPNIIPPVNQNAPNRTIYDITKCYYSREALTAPRISPIPQLNVNPLVYIPSFTLVGELANMGTLIQNMNNQSRQIVNFFNDIKRIRLAEQFNREIYIPKFTEFPTGRSDKALVSISKDKILWFKLEAGILRYNNCPIIKRKKYSYKHIHYQNEFKELCKFTMRAEPAPENLIRYKTKVLKPITSQSYPLTIDSMRSLIGSDLQSGRAGLLNTVKDQIYLLNNRIKALSQSSQPTANLEKDLSDYRSLYKSIGPEGIQIDDIIKFETSTTNPENNITTTTFSYYFVNDAGSLVPFSNISTLLVHNKSLYIENNLNTIQQYLTKPLTTSTTSNAPQTPAESDIVVIKGTRPYSIYKKDDSVKIFTPKTNLTDAENQQLARWGSEISQLQSSIADESNKQIPDQERITSLRNQILSLENQIFSYSHTESSNTIISKGIFRNENSYSTIFRLAQIVKDNSILVIQPSDNRIVAYDNNYMGVQHKKKVINTWAFANDSVLSNDNVRASRENIFNYGTYGTGGISNSSKILYSAEIVNYVKDFIDYIDRNRNLDDNFKEDYVLYNGGVEIKGSINMIHTFGFDNKEYLIKKYNNFIKLKPKNTTPPQFEDVLKIFDTIMTYDVYNSFFNQNTLKSLVEGKLETNLSGLSIGNNDTIEFISNNKAEIVYDYNGVDGSSTSSVSLLSSRINSYIPDEIRLKQSQIDSIQLQIAGLPPASSQVLKQQIETLKQDIAKLKLEYNTLAYYLENINKSNPGGAILGNVCLDIQNNGNKVAVKDDPNIDIDNYYIINIDAEQGCSLDYDKLPKILVGIRYQCLTVIGPAFVNPFRFCPNTPGLTFLKIGDYEVSIKNETEIEYKMTQEKIDNLISQNSHPELSWAAMPRSSERTFFLNGKDTRGGIVKAIYTYLVPEYSPNRQINSDSNLNNKVKDIFNLDNLPSNKIYVDFRRINRNLRNVDSLYYKHVPTVDGLLVKSLTPPPGGPIDNTLKIWQCYGVKDGSNLSLPLNFKWMNLVKYMTFYNKFLFTNQNEIFDINGGLDAVRTRDEMGLIPYDYK